MSIQKGEDLDVLFERAANRRYIDPAEVLELIKRLRAYRAIEDDVLALFTTPDQFPALRLHASTDAPFHAALRIIRVYRERNEALERVRELVSSFHTRRELDDALAAVPR